MFRIVGELLHPIAQLRHMHAQVLRSLHIGHASLLDQAHSLKLELAGKLPSLHDTPPAPSKRLTRCLRNRVQAIVLPPVGSARSAILLLECIEHFIGSALFSNPEIQIQVCSPGRLDARRSALLAIGFYLGSDTLRRYTLGDLAPSFPEHQRYPRG